MTQAEMCEHVQWLIKAFMKRGLDEREALAVMGQTVCAMITGNEARAMFIDTMKRSWKISDAALRPGTGELN